MIGYNCVQEGIIDELKILADTRPGPLVATSQFLAEDDRFEVDEARFTKHHRSREVRVFRTK
jgi:hypothetical protein